MFSALSVISSPCVNDRRSCSIAWICCCSSSRPDLSVSGSAAELLAERLGLRVEPLVVLVDRGLLGGQIERQIVGKLHRREERAEAVVVGLRERIVFVVVAAAAAQRQAEKRRGRRFRHVGQQLGAAAILLVEQLGRVVVRAEPQVAGRDQASPARRASSAGRRTARRRQAARE